MVCFDFEKAKPGRERLIRSMRYLMLFRRSMSQYVSPYDHCLIGGVARGHSSRREAL